MTDPESIGQDAPRRGVAIKLLGVVLIILGVLDSMLSWRGGFEVSDSYALLIGSGLFLYIVGAIRSGSRTQTEWPCRPTSDPGRAPPARERVRR